MTITIGSDELILWLRKNEKAIGISNDTLGNDISTLIQGKYGGSIVQYDQPVHWQADSDSKNIDPYKLPKSTAQYSINTEHLSDLYETLNAW